MTALSSRRPEDAPVAAARPAAGAPQAGRTLVERTVLDEQVAAARAADPRPWGLRSWLGPLLTLAALIVVSAVLAAVVPAQGTARTVGAVALSVGTELVLLAALLTFGRPIAAREGGWRAALGLDRVRRCDWLPWIIGVGFTFAGRALVGVLAWALSNGRANAEASNLTGTDGSVVSIVVLVLVAVVLAPVTEELMFRGLLLRTFMRRMGFWPAALLSTALFAGFHAYEVDTVAGALTLVATVGILGLCNCFLVRITGRLTPGMMVHASFNALAVLIVLVTTSS